MNKIIITCFITTLFSCSNNQTNESATFVTKNYAVQPLQIDNGEEEGWGADIRLSIVEKSENDTSHIYKAVSSYEGKELGLLVFVPKRKESDKGFGKGISFKRIGTSSDNLLQTLSRFYKQTVDSAAIFAKDITVTYVNLKELAKSITGKEGQYKATDEYKLFFEGNRDEDYAELYLNINSTENWIELREKDEEYRTAILRFLRK